MAELLTFQIFYVKVVIGQCSDPSMSSGIEIGCHHHVSERIVVSPYEEGFQ